MQTSMHQNVVSKIASLQQNVINKKVYTNILLVKKYEPK